MTRFRTSRLRGFTLVELLVVLALTAILMALLFPAIAESRQKARSVMCINNLKQIGLAMHNYHDTYRTFPPGWIAHTNLPGNGYGYGWQTSILPFMDQASLFDQVNFNQPFQSQDEAEDLSPFQAQLESYRCPNDPTPVQNPYRGGFATSNYSGVFGDRPLPRWSNVKASTLWAGTAPTPQESTGTFWVNSSVRFGRFRDGMSNTFLVGERCAFSGSGIWVGVNSNEFENDAVTDCSYRNPLNKTTRSFSSFHTEGVNFLYGDGSVHVINRDIESGTAPDKPGAYQHLANTADGMQVPQF